MKKLLVCIIGTVFFFTGCFKKAPINRYYLLDYVPTPPKVQTKIAIRPVTLRIKEFKIAEAYKRSEIVYRKSSHEMQFYNFHQWAVKPEFLVTDMIFKHLRAANIFRSISRSLVDFRPDYVLSGEVVAIEEYDSEEKWFAHLAINFHLTDTKTDKQVWSQIFDVRKEVARQEPVYVVREMSSLLEYITDQAIIKIRNRLPRYAIPKENPKKTQPAAKPEANTAPEKESEQQQENNSTEKTKQNDD